MVAVEEWVVVVVALVEEAEVLELEPVEEVERSVLAICSSASVGLERRGWQLVEQHVPAPAVAGPASCAVAVHVGNSAWKDCQVASASAFAVASYSFSSVRSTGLD